MSPPHEPAHFDEKKFSQEAPLHEKPEAVSFLGVFELCYRAQALLYVEVLCVEVK